MHRAYFPIGKIRSVLRSTPKMSSLCFFFGERESMSHTVTENPTTAPAPAVPVETLLSWQVHLLRHDSSRLSVLGLVLLFAFFTVWLMFHSPLPAVLAVLLLFGAVSEYLFPVR